MLTIKPLYIHLQLKQLTANNQASLENTCIKANVGTTLAQNCPTTDNNKHDRNYDAGTERNNRINCRRDEQHVKVF